MPLPSPSDSNGPFVSVLTAPSRGAIAVVRLWGEGAVGAADAAFRPHRGASLAGSPVGRPRVGRIGAGTGDEVVAVVVEEEGGRPPEAEVQCHGGPVVVELVVDALVSAGASRRSAEDWVLSRATSPLRGRAELDLVHAETERAARILLEQAAGALDEALRRLEGTIDSDPPVAIAELAAMIRRADVGTRLVGGWRVALAGRPNVGKSRLLNAMAGFGRAIVSPTPGTTRDVVTARLAIDGWPVELADTAGLRATVDPIEAVGVAMARGRHGGADLVLLVLDRSEPLTEADRALFAERPGAMIVCNKADLPAAWEPEPSWGDVAVVSADRGDGLDDLLASVARRLVPDPPPPGAAVPFRADQARLLSRVLRLLHGGRDGAAARHLDRLRRRGGGPADRGLAAGSRTMNHRSDVT